MLHDILYILHVLGMVSVLFLSGYLLVRRNIQTALKKKFALYLMSASHTQLLTGFILFFILLSQINHAKIGVKLLLAFVVAALASIYKKKTYSDQQPHPLILPALFITVIVVTAVAFLW